MATARKKVEIFFIFLFFLILVTSLKGCFALPALMVADGVQHYAGKVVLTGAEIARMADWHNRYEKEVKFSMPGVDRGTYSCARQSGTELCVLSEQAVKSNISSRATFECHLGRGGPLSNVIFNDSSTLYCSRT